MVKIAQNIEPDQNKQAAVPLDISSAVPVPFNFNPKLASGKVARLLGSIEHRLPGRGAPAVHFTSVYAGEGAGIIAFETAYATANATGKRVLFLDCSKTTERSAIELKDRTDIVLDEFLKQENAFTSGAFSYAEGTTFFYARFSGTGGNESAAFDVQFARSLFDRLKATFDLVIIHSEAAITSGAAATLAALADGTIIVIEAERTRLPVVKECRQSLESLGGRVEGTVLNRRRYYIPRWLYSLLYHRPGSGSVSRR